jgi:sulfur-carrier protein
MLLTVQYFARLHEQSGVAEEIIESVHADLAAIYAVLQAKHGFGFPQSALKPVCNDVIVDWAHAVKANDVIAFLPPFSGG